MLSLFSSSFSCKNENPPGYTFFSRGHATLHLAVSVGPSVRRSEIFLKLRAVFALLLLSIRPRLDCRVSGLVFILIKFSILTPVDTLNLAIRCSPSYANGILIKIRKISITSDIVNQSA